MIGLTNAINLTGINVVTKSKSLLRLAQPAELQKIKTPREPQLPKIATEGLKGALSQCNRPPKQLQHEADVLYEKILQRRFPASKEVMLTARSTILKKMKESGMEKLDENVYGSKINKAHTDYLNAKVGKLLRQSNYSWKALDFENREKAATYALGMLSSHFSEIYRVLCEFNTNEFVPETVLDFGSGIGSSFWACNEKFGNAVKEYTLVDVNPIISQFSMDIMRSNKDNNVFIHPNVNFRRSLVPSLQIKYDLVIAHRSLIEFANKETRLELIKSLWQRTNKYLIIIESHMEDSFNAILEARDYILEEGKKVDFSKIKEVFDKYGIFDEEIQNVLENNLISDFEKYYLLKAKLPKDAVVPTMLESGYVYAPCPHDQQCPKKSIVNTKKSTCTFSIKYRDIRADGKPSKLRNGTGNTAFSYIILEKGDRPIGKEFYPRLIKLSKGNKHFTCQSCTLYNGLQHYVISKKNKHFYQQTKGLNHGDKIPYKIIVEKKLSENDVLYDDLLNLDE
uniref:Methyltransferase-like protein 17, mitochondrial n=1 Tax=Parastrongyloides trichosuri TaxID=131310 RepID=A0A0N4ZUE8_PARTI